MVRNKRSINLYASIVIPSLFTGIGLLSVYNMLSNATYGLAEIFLLPGALLGLGIGYIKSRSLLKMLRGMESKAKISDIDSTNMITKLSISVYLPTLFIHGFGIIGLAETLVYFLAPGTFAEFWSMYSYRVIGLGIFFGLVEGYLLTGQFRRDWMSEDQELNEAS